MNNNLLRVLQNRSFFSLWLSEIFAQLAMNMMNFILLLVAYNLTHSNTAVSGIVLAFTIPGIIFGIVAGVYVDRWSKKSVLFGTNISRAILILLLVFFHQNLLIVYAVTFCVAVITQFFIPAETPMIPLLVDKKDLLSANALFGIAIYGSILVAYALSGPVLILLGTTQSLLLISILYIISSLGVLFIRLSQKEQLKQGDTILPTKSLMQEISHTLKSIFEIKRLFHAFSLIVLAQVLIFIVAVIGPGYAQQVLHIHVNDFPFLFVTPAVLGMAIGTYLLTHFWHQKRKEHTSTAGLFLLAATLCAMPFASRVTSREFVHSLNIILPHVLKITNLHLLVVLAAVMGFANSLIFVPSNTIVQEETSDEVRGKIYGALNTITALVSFVPIILVGSLADIFGVSGVLIALAVSVGIIGLLRLLL